MTVTTLLGRPRTVIDTVEPLATECGDADAVRAVVTGLDVAVASGGVFTSGVAVEPRTSAIVCSCAGVAVGVCVDGAGVSVCCTTIPVAGVAFAASSSPFVTEVAYIGGAVGVATLCPAMSVAVGNVMSSRAAPADGVGVRCGDDAE